MVPTEYEITISGPRPDITELYKKFASSRARIAESTRNEVGPQATIFINEPEDDIDSRLTFLAGLINRAEEDETKEIFEIHVRNLSRSEPVAGSAQFLTPFSPVPGLLVRPWLAGQASHIPADPEAIILDPDFAFGTGKHPTTRLCLELLSQLFAKEKNFSGLKDSTVLDLGCGTGLLAIVAARLGAGKVLGLDINHQAVIAARRNVSINGLAGKIEIRQGSLEMTPEKYDLVLANLVTSVLLQAGKEMAPHLCKQGRAIVSGFSLKQAPDMRRFFTRQGLKIEDQTTTEGWAALLLSR